MEEPEITDPRRWERSRIAGEQLVFDSKEESGGCTQKPNRGDLFK